MFAIFFCIQKPQTEQHTRGPNKALLNNHKLQPNSKYEHLAGEVPVRSSSIISEPGGK